MVRISVGDRGWRLAGAAALAASLLLLLAAPALAATVNLSCPGGPFGPFPNINAAVAAVGSTPGCTITVTGTTVEPTISLFNVRNLTIDATSVGAATITPNAADIDAFDIEHSTGILLHRLIISWPSGSTGGYGVYAFNHSEVNVSETTVRGFTDPSGTGSGVGVDSDSSAVISKCTLEGNADGVDVMGGSSAVIRNSVLQNNTSVGIFVYDRSSALINGQSSVSGNLDTGAYVQDLSRLQVAGTTAIDNNRCLGILGAAQSIIRMSGQSKVRNNGSNDPICSQSLTGTGGIALIRNSTFRSASALEISGNIGNGVIADQGIDAAFNDTKFLNNTGDGFRVIRLSNGSLVSGNTFSGNGGASFSCDSTSLVSGDISGITKFDCKQVERVNGPPRPGRFKEPNP